MSNRILPLQQDYDEFDNYGKHRLEALAERDEEQRHGKGPTQSRASRCLLEQNGYETNHEKYNLKKKLQTPSKDWTTRRKLFDTVPADGEARGGDSSGRCEVPGVPEGRGAVELVVIWLKWIMRLLKMPQASAVDPSPNRHALNALKYRSPAPRSLTHG